MTDTSLTPADNKKPSMKTPAVVAAVWAIIGIITSYTGPLMVALAAFAVAFVGLVLVWVAAHDRRLQRAPAGATHVETVREWAVNQTVEKFHNMSWELAGPASGTSKERVALTFRKVD